MSRVRVCAHCVSRRRHVHVARSFFVTFYRISVCPTALVRSILLIGRRYIDTDTQGDVRRGTGPPYALEIEHGEGGAWEWEALRLRGTWLDSRRCLARMRESPRQSFMFWRDRKRAENAH